MLALIGGGSAPRPGELSLAHYGILFLDEFVEFPRHVLEMIRQPLEDGFVIVSRAKKTIQFPAQFMLVAAMNPCPCGYFGSNLRSCKCSPGQIDTSGERMLKEAMMELGLSARAHDKICKVARIIADLEGSDDIRGEHVAEAISYRKLDRKL